LLKKRASREQVIVDTTGAIKNGAAERTEKSKLYFQIDEGERSKTKCLLVSFSPTPKQHFRLKRQNTKTSEEGQILRRTVQEPWAEQETLELVRR
jgi:hypothetical protein